MPEWLEPYRDVLLWLGTISLISLAVSALVIPIVVCRIPQYYFAPARSRRRPRATRTAWRLLLLGLKNLLGAAFVLAGVAMLVLPGQGILTILIGLLIMDFPGKYALERSLVRRPAVLKSLNWIRKKAGKPLLVVGSSAEAE